jgi:hypothetical protein
MHLVSLNLYLVSTQDAHKVILVKQLLCRLLTKQIRALTLLIVDVVLSIGDLVGHWVRPKQVAENTVEWNLLVAINLINLL